MSFLMLATQRVYSEKVKLFLDYGADVEKKDSRFPTDLMLPAGETPLFAASRKGHVEIVNLLLVNGASVFEKDTYGQTALTHATPKGNNEIIMLLIKAGAKQ